jgi:putative hydrolase of the HAD superfamily
MTDPLIAKFGHVTDWIFDLDNTLYPADSGLWPEIERRITLFLIQHTGLDGASARALQRYYYHRHGTTLRGLVDEDSVSAEAFLDFVHDIDRSGLAANPDLALALAALPGRKLIFTNGSRHHALMTIERLGLAGLFEDPFDIVAAGLTPKPRREAYESFYRAHGVDPKRAAMFEDIAKNLGVPKADGMTTVLVTPRVGQVDHRQPEDGDRGPPSEIDFWTDDLAAFLTRVIDAFASEAHSRRGPETAT